MEQERRRLMYLVFAFAALLMIGIFLTDWIFSTTDLMTEGILGMIVGSALTWPAAYVAYHTTEDHSQARNHQQNITPTPPTTEPEAITEPEGESDESGTEIPGRPPTPEPDRKRSIRFRRKSG